ASLHNVHGRSNLSTPKSRVTRVAEREELLAKAARDLQWEAILEALASQASSSVGADRCRRMRLATTLAETFVALEETAEMVSLEQGSGGMPMAHFPDVRSIIERAAKGAFLNAPDLRDLSIVLGLVAEVHSFLKRHQNDAPRIAALATNLDDLEPLKSAIDHAIDPDGNILESATPELRLLTRQASSFKQKIRVRLEAILASSQFAEILQDS